MKLTKLLIISLVTYLILTPLRYTQAEQGDITATVKIGVVSVTISPSSFDYGEMPFNGLKDSYDAIDVLGEKNIKATVSIVKTDLYIKGLDTQKWFLSDLSGQNQYVHSFGTALDSTTRPSSYSLLTTSSKILTLNIPPEQSIWFGLQIKTPSSGNATQQSAGVIVTAFHSD